MEKYVYVALLSLCIVMGRASVISIAVFLVLCGLIIGTAAGRVFLFHKYELFWLADKGGTLSENGEILVLCISVFLYLMSLSFLAVGSWLFFQ